MSYNINYQHIVFRTFRSHHTIPERVKRLLLAYINNVSNEMGVPIKRLNAYKNHVHILADIPVSILITEYVRKIKSTSSKAFKGNVDFPLFEGWARGYGSFSVSCYEKDIIINYIKNQEEHHRVKSFKEELEELFGDEFIANNKYWNKDWEV